MDLYTDEELFLQDSPLLETRFAPEPASTAVSNEFTKSVRNREDAGNKESLDLPVNNKESCTLDLDMEIECHSEPLIAWRTQPRSGCVPNPASLSDNSKQPVGATTVSPQKNFATLQPLHLNSPSTLASAVSSRGAKNVEKTCDTLADKMVPLRIKGDGSAAIIMVSADKLATLKESQKKGVVCTVQLAQENWITANSSANNLITKKQNTSRTSSPALPRPFPQPLLCLRAPTSAPISAANSTKTVTQAINAVPKLCRSSPILTMSGLPPESQLHSIVTSLNNSSHSNLVFMSSPHNVTSKNTRVMNILPSVAYQKTATGYQVLGSPVSTSIPVPALLPISNRIPTKSVNPILLSGSVVRTTSPTTSANAAASVTGVTWRSVTSSTPRQASSVNVLPNLKDLMNIKTSPTPVRPVAPKVSAIMSQKTIGKLASTSMGTREYVVPMVQPDGSVIHVKKTVPCLGDPNNEQADISPFTLKEVSNNPSETGLARKFVICPTSAVPVSTAAQFNPSVNSSLNFSNHVNNGGILSSVLARCSDYPIEKRLQHTPVQWHQPYSGKSPSSKVGRDNDGRPVSWGSQTATYIHTCLNNEDDRVAHEIWPPVVAETKKNPEISAETSSSTDPVEHAEYMKIPIPVSTAVNGSFQLHQNSSVSDNPDSNTEIKADTEENPDLSIETISCVEYTQDIKPISSSNSPSLMEPWHHPSTASSTNLDSKAETNILQESPNVQNHETIPSTVGARSIETHAPPRFSKMLQNCEFSEKLNKKRKNQADTVDYPPAKMPKNEKELQVKKACVDNDSLPKTQPLGSVASAVDGLPCSRVQMEDQLHGTGDRGANSHVTPLQWHHPCSDPLENGADGDSKVIEELDAVPVPENSPGPHEKTCRLKIAANLSATFPPNSSSSGENEIVKYEVEDESEQKDMKIRTKEWSKSPRTGNSDDPASPCISDSSSSSLKWQDPLDSAPSSIDAALDSVAQIEPTSPEIKIASQSIPGKSEVESAVHHIPGSSEMESSTQNINEEPVLVSDDDYDDDDQCAIPSPRSTGSTEEKPGSPDDSYSLPPTDESISVKIDCDLDIPIIDHGSIHSTDETALQCRDPSKNTESAVKTESPSDSECNSNPSTSRSFMVNEENEEEKYTLCSELEGLDHGSEKDIHNIGNVCSTATGSRALEKPSSSTGGRINESRNFGGVPARTAYPTALLKWNRERIHKMQLNLKRRLKMKEQGQVNLSVKRKILDGKGTRPKKSQKLNDSCNLTTGSKQCDDERSSSSGFKMQKDSPREVASNVLRDCIVRKTIQDCYSKKLIPSIQMIDDACCDSGLNFSKETLQPYLNAIGFNWISCSSGRLLAEDPRFTTKRIEYLDQLEAYSGKNLVYLFVSDLVARAAGWQTYPYNARDVLDSKSGNLYVVLHAMSNTSLIGDGLLVLKLDQYGVNTSRIGSWLKNIVLPKVPKGSVVILGDGIFDLTVEPVERPHMGHSKARIISWLKSHKVTSVNPDLPKAMLLSKAYDAVVPRTSVFDQTIRQCGFETLYLPKHHKDLNPIEFLWQDILDKLNKTPDVKYFEDFVEQEFLSCSQKVMSVASVLVRKFEATYRNFDFCFDELFDSMTSIVGPVDDGIPKEPPAETPKTSKPVTNPNIHVCPVCRNPATLTGFRCFKCRSFWRHLTRKYRKGKTLPVCRMYTHVSTRPPFCHGCRRNQYELAFLKTYPNKPLPLPPVTFKGEKHSRTIPFKTYPETSKSSFRTDGEFDDSV